VTREQLEALGMTDEELDKEYEAYIGFSPGLSLEPEDTPMVQRRRAAAWEEIKAYREGVSEPINPGAPLGSFADERIK